MSELAEVILDWVHSAWSWIKKIWVKIVNFFKNIVAWFKNYNRLKKLEEDKNRIAIVIKEKKSNEEYNIVNCLFNEATEEVEEAEVVQSEQLDAQTVEIFGDKDMVILQ